MDIMKIVGIGLITCVAVLVVKPSKPDIAPLIALAGGVIILFYLLDSIENIIVSFQSIIDTTGINTYIFKLILKILGIGYLVEFASGICKDSGNSSLGEKIELAGKIIIITIALPIIQNIINVLLEILP